MNKCSCLNPWCRCLFGCGCQNNLNNNIGGECLCCTLSKELKKKKYIHKFEYDNNYDDVIVFNNSDNFYQSIRYECRVNIEGQIPDFNNNIKHPVISDIKITYPNTTDHLFVGSLNTNGYKLINFINKNNMYSFHAYVFDSMIDKQ